MKIVKCLECLKETENPKFCSSGCAARYNNKNRLNKCTNKHLTKFGNCSCGNLVEINIRGSLLGIKCNICKIKSKYVTCKNCGEINCKNRLCRGEFLLNSDFVKYFGFDKSVIGSKEVFKEIDRIKHIIEDMYSTLSIIEIAEIINYDKDVSTLYANLKRFGITFRSIPDAMKLSLLNGRVSEMPNCQSYKSGWRKTWEGKDVFYRSSYELEYSEYLDKNLISYDIENLRIEYWDSQRNCYRIAIPDFYIIDSNTIVEIKSTYFYDPINMKDKVIRYRDLGYSFKLILDKEEINIDASFNG